MPEGLTIGLPRMYAEAGERRDFLPDFVSRLEKNGARVLLEHSYGSGIGFQPDDYLALAPNVRFVSHAKIYEQDYVLLVRCPDEVDLRRMHPGACLISMLHYPTRPDRVALLRSLEIEAISLDSIKNDEGRRLIENLRSVAWNGVEAAFQTLRQIYPSPGFDSPERGPLYVTLLGAGAVGTHVVQAATRYGDPQLWSWMADRGLPGVQLTVIEYDTARHEDLIRKLLATTDLLVDATQRPDPSLPVVLNEWIADMPLHAVLLDLSVDPYRCDFEPVYVKGIEGIPQGNLDQYVFAPDDPAFERVPPCIPTTHRRYSVSCYSWPGVHPKECMEGYGHQLRPLLRTLIEKGGTETLNPRGNFFERALCRALLSRWSENNYSNH